MQDALASQLLRTCCWLIRRTHELRYVLKNKETGDVYFVVVFTLLLREDVEKEEAEEAQKKGNSNASQSGHKGDAAMAKGGFQPSADDLD